MTYDSKKTGLFSSLMQLGVLSILRKPLVSTILLFLAGALFAAIVMMGYPDSPNDNDQIPVVVADSAPVKSLPETRGGMDIPNRDSTVFDVMRGDDMLDRPVVENLLEQSTEPPMTDISEAITPAEAPKVTPPPVQTQPKPAADQTPALALNTRANAPSAAPPQESLTPPTPTVEKTPPKTQPQPQPATKTPQPAPAPKATAPTAPVKKQAVAKPKPVVKKPTETVEYVRTVLNDDAPKSATITPGGYYVQLASIKSESAAKGEWDSLRKKYGALSGASYRVKRADLGAKGIFYRIQAGGMSKASAEAVCKSIKAKSGGCFVTK